MGFHPAAFRCLSNRLFLSANALVENPSRLPAWTALQYLYTIVHESHENNEFHIASVMVQDIQDCTAHCLEQVEQ